MNSRPSAKLDPPMSPLRSQWVQAGQLLAGEHLLKENGQTLTITAITADPGLHRVYNRTMFINSGVCRVKSSGTGKGRSEKQKQQGAPGSICFDL